jgi:hypothetical protein
MADKIITDRVWKIVAEKGWVGFGLLGLAFAIIGGAANVPIVGEVRDPIAQSIFLYFGLALIVFAAAAYWYSPTRDRPATPHNITLPIISHADRLPPGLE